LTKAILTSNQEESNLLENGGHLSLTNSWARALLNRLDYVKRKPTTDRKLNANELIVAASKMKIIEDKISLYHPDLVLEMDETLAPWATSNDFTYAPRGANRVVINAKDDKRGSTVTLTITRSSIYLPPQIIWSGQTKASIPHFNSNNGLLNCFAGKTGESVIETNTSHGVKTKTLLKKKPKLFSFGTTTGHTNFLEL